MYFNTLGEAAGGASGGGMSEVSVLLNTGEHKLIIGEYGQDGNPGNTHYTNISVAGGVGGWLDDDTIVYGVWHHVNGEQYIESCNVRTMKRTRLREGGMNRLRAGGGKWAGWGGANRGGEVIGVFGDFQTLNGYVASAAHDGTFAISADYQSDSGMALYAKDGRVTYLPEQENAYDIHITGPTSAVWVHTKTGEFRTINMRVPLQVAPALSPKVARVGDEDWIVYWTEAVGLITHPVDSLQGYIIRHLSTITGQNGTYWHDAMGLNGKLRVGYSRTQGEARDHFVIHDLDLTLPRFDFASNGEVNGNGAVVIAPKAPDVTTFTQFATGGSSVANSSALIAPQCGLLEDDIVYRLALLAVNVLQPLKNQYPNIVIKSGFRQVNTGISQHELGEAVDLQIVNQSPELLYEVANWIKHNLPFDQMVLNYTNIGDGQGWIHISFSPKSLRYQVLTKDFADTFHEGLYFIEAMTGEEAAAAARDQASLDALIFEEMRKTGKRNDKMLPVSSVMDEVQTILTGTAARDASGLTGAGSGSTGTGASNNNQRAALVACVQRALNLKGVPYSDQHNVNIAFEVIKRVAWLLRDEGCGLQIGPSGGENIVFWNGYHFRAGRVIYPDGQIYKLLTGVEDGPDLGFHVPGWVDDGVIEQDKYVPAMDPGDDINQNWLQCPLPPPDPVATGTGT